MKKQILIISGHPNNESFCNSLTDSYYKGAEKNFEIKRLNLCELKFDPILHLGFKGDQPLEPDLIRSQELITRANHIVIVSPLWWGTMPALLKGFFDRILLPGFAFKYHQNDPMWDKLLKGKSARLIITSDSPRWFTILINKDPMVNTLKHCILEFCGIKPVKLTNLTGVRKSTPEKREKWLKEVYQLGIKGL